MIRLDEWMTAFYGCRWSVISSSSDIDAIEDGLIEWRVPCDVPADIETAQRRGFTLVETAIHFETRVELQEPPPAHVRAGAPTDIAGVLALLGPCFLQHPHFHSRFKNRTFFTDDQCRDYYTASVKNHFAAPDAVSVVAEDRDGVAAFRIMKKMPDGFYQGVIGAVHPRAKGHGLLGLMQRRASALIGHPYMERNSTQLGNYPVIRSHLSAGRLWSGIEHIFYKKR